MGWLVIFLIYWRKNTTTITQIAVIIPDILNLSAFLLTINQVILNNL